MKRRITLDYFRNECSRFREIMTTRGNSVEKIDAAMSGLFFVFVQATSTGNDDRLMPKKDHETAQAWFDALFEEWNRRKPWMIFIAEKSK